MLDRIDDTIVAVSSAAGYGTLALVRLSGPLAITIADQMSGMSDRVPLIDRHGSTRIVGEVAIDDGLYLPAFFYLFRAPHSYTRQDIVEIQTVGSPCVAELVRNRALRLGAIPALPGEFTARAFFNGAMDLSQAEAVGGLIRAQSDTQLRAARRIMDGALAEQITQTRDVLAELVALIEADIDFAEEPIEFLTPAELRTRLRDVTSRLERLRNSAPSVEHIDVLPCILLLGPPNAGKSTLTNRLSGIPRSICAAAAGTTRDILSVAISLGRGEAPAVGEAILLDTAGIASKLTRKRACPCQRSVDEIVSDASAMALSKAEQVDLVCLVVDATNPDANGAAGFSLLGCPRGLKPAAQLGRTVIVVNKCDLVSDANLSDVVRTWEQKNIGPVCQTSALSGTGIEHLRETMRLALGEEGSTTSAETVYLTERQQTAISDAIGALHRATQLTSNTVHIIDSAELLAFELRDALDALGSVTGEVATEDLLNRVFANFCIGK